MKELRFSVVFIVLVCVVFAMVSVFTAVYLVYDSHRQTKTITDRVQNTEKLLADQKKEMQQTRRFLELQRDAFGDQKTALDNQQKALDAMSGVLDDINKNVIAELGTVRQSAHRSAAASEEAEVQSRVTRNVVKKALPEKKYKWPWER